MHDDERIEIEIIDDELGAGTRAIAGCPAGGYHHGVFRGDVILTYYEPFYMEWFDVRHYVYECTSCGQWLFPYRRHDDSTGVERYYQTSDRPDQAGAWFIPFDVPKGEYLYTDKTFNQLGWNGEWAN